MKQLFIAGQIQLHDRVEGSTNNFFMYQNTNLPCVIYVLVVESGDHVEVVSAIKVTLLYSMMAPGLHCLPLTSSIQVN